MDKDPIIRKAQNRVKAKKGFYIHFGVYLATAIFFLLMNLVTMDAPDDWWFFYPLIPWLVGLLIHYFVVFGFPGTNILTDGWEERELEKEINRLRRKHRLSGASSSVIQEPPSPEEELELRDPEKVKDYRWDEEDIV